MSCPDWRSLRDRRDREPEGWAAAVRHLDGCPRCREAALDAEPTLLFQRLPAPRVRAGEIAAMKQAVAALRRNSRRPARPAWTRAAAAAVLVTAALLEGAVRPGDEAGEAGLLAARGVAAGVADFAPSGVPAPAVERMPLVEYSDPRYGSVIEVVDDEVSLVLVLPPVNDV